MAELVAQTNSIGKTRKFAVGLENLATVPTAAKALGVSIVDEAGGGPFITTRVSFSGTTITITDQAGVVGYGGLKILDFPLGRILFVGASANLSAVYGGTIIATADGHFGVGTVTASNNATLATTEQNIIPTTAIAQAVGSAASIVGGNAAVAYIDGTATAVDAFLNVLIADADQNGGGTVTVTGDLYLTWMLVGPK